jgi:cell division protein FtsB
VAAAETRARRPASAAPSAGEMRRRRRRLTTIGAAAGLLVMLVALGHQYAKTYALAREGARLEQRRRDLIADNARLREEIQRLQTDDRYIEEIARRQLGLVRPGEIELLVVPYDGTVSAPGAASERGTPAGVQRPEPSAGPATGAGDAAAPPRPQRGIARWAIGVRDAIWRLLHLPPSR